MSEKNMIILFILIGSQSAIINYYYIRYKWSKLKLVLYSFAFMFGGSCINYLLLKQSNISLGVVGTVISLQWMLCLSIEDIAKKKISFKSLLVGFCIGEIYSLINPNINMWINNITVIFMCLVLFGISKITKESIGEGDVVVLGILGIILGVKDSVIIMFLALFLCALVGLVLLVTNKGNKKTRIAFIPFVLCSEMIYIFLQ